MDGKEAATRAVVVMAVAARAVVAMVEVEMAEEARAVAE